MNISLYEAFENRPDRLYFARTTDDFLPDRADILEIGCGNGEAAEFLAERGHNVTALDIVKRNIRRKDVRFVQADGANIPMESGSFDCVYCEASFSSIKDKVSAAEEIYRLLRPGGCLVLVDYVLKAGENTALVPSLNGTCREDEYASLFSKLQLVESRDEVTFLVGLMLHLCHTYSLNYGELIMFLGASEAKYGFKTFIYKK